MSDEKKEDQAAPPLPVIENAEYPTGHLFPDDLLREWVGIPPDEPLVIGPLTRRDLDHLLFSFANVTSAIANLRQGLIEYSHGRLEHANVYLQTAFNRNLDAESRNRLLFEAIMKSAIGMRKNAGK